MLRGDAAEKARFEGGCVGDVEVEWDLERRGLLQVEDMAVRGKSAILLRGCNVAACDSGYLGLVSVIFCSYWYSTTVIDAARHTTSLRHPSQGLHSIDVTANIPPKN